MIRCFIFDLKGVVFETGKRIAKRLADEGFDPQKLELLWEDVGFGGHDYVTGAISYEEYESHVKEAFPDSYHYLIQTYFGDRRLLSISRDKLIKEIIEPYDIDVDLSDVGDTLTTLDLIKKLSPLYDLCVFSGNTKEQLDVMDAKFHFLQYFPYKVFSYQVGVDKPDQKMFDKLAQTIPHSPSECLYTDDRDGNIMKGKALGYNVVLFDSIAA